MARVSKVLVGLVFLCSKAQAQVWKNVELGAGYHIAKVSNDAGYVTGVICQRRTSCSAYIVSPASCEENASYPMMINSPVGAFPITAKCVAVGGYMVLGIDQLENALAAFRSGGEIGFAIPLQSGKFNAVRFSTAGATAAIDQAVKAAATDTTHPTAPAPSRSTSVQTL